MKLILIAVFVISGCISSSDSGDLKVSINVDSEVRDNINTDSDLGNDSNEEIGIDNEGDVTALFNRVWSYSSATSAIIYWQTDALNKFMKSYVEYGDTSSYGERTEITSADRVIQFHRITGLSTNKIYHYRMVFVTNGGNIFSEDRTFETSIPSNAILIETSGAQTLSTDGATYLLTRDITAPGTAIEITGRGIVLDLDGHTVTFGTASTSQVFGIYVRGGGTIIVKNGHVVQGGSAGDYSSAVESRHRADPLEVYGISTEISRPNGYPFRVFGSGRDISIHHNSFYSTVREIESRHYPGNDLVRIDSSVNVKVYDNILTEGTHRGMRLSSGSNTEVYYNDIRHHARYVNGYALAVSSEANIHHNSITSMGRGVHLTADNIEFHHNHIDIKGHMTLSDLPANTLPLHERMIELHGVKLEGSSIRNAKIYNNYVRIIQYLPDGVWEYVPATPLNIASYDANAMNEVYDNTFIALTEYSQTRHGGYGDSGEWASAIYLVAMDKGAANSGMYSVYVHNNKFISNDLFVGTGYTFNMTVRIENNIFTLATGYSQTNSSSMFMGLSTSQENLIRDGGNQFIGVSPFR